MAEYVCVTDGWFRKLTDERIVRCRDCEHYTEKEAGYYHYCSLLCRYAKPDGFCWCGELKEEK